MPEADGYFEKRKHKRIEKKFTVHYRLVGKEEDRFIPEDKKEVSSRDISVSGMQIECDEQIDKDRMIRIDIETGDKHGPIQTFAEVRWVVRDGYTGKYRAGLEFLVLKEDHIKVIESIIK